MNYSFPVVVGKDSDGYFALCPALKGCFAQGETYEDVLENISDAVSLHVQDRVACGEEVCSFC